MIFAVLGAVLLAAFGLWKFFANRAEQQQSVAAIPVKLATVAKGPLDTTLRVTGAIGARDFVNVVAPRMTGPESERPLLVMKLVSTGSLVKEGQIVMEIDGQAMLDHIDDVNSTVVQSEADIRKRVAEQQVEAETLAQSVRVAKADVDKLRVDARASEVRTVIDQELIKLSIEESEARYNQLLEEVRLKKESQASELRILEFTRERHTRHRDRHKRDVLRFTVRAPMDGMAVVQNVWRSGEFTAVGEGDQVFPGQLVLKVVNPKNMDVEGTISQANIASFRLGQPAKVHFDAFPDLVLNGKVDAIGAIAIAGFRQNAYVRTIPVRVHLTDSDPRVIPDLSASADVRLSRVADSTIVPLGAVREEDGKSVVFVRGAKGLEKREVELGARNEVQAAVLSGLSAGDQVALNYEVAAAK